MRETGEQTAAEDLFWPQFGITVFFHDCQFGREWVNLVKIDLKSGVRVSQR